MKKYTIFLAVIFLTMCVPIFSQTLTVSNSVFEADEKFVLIKSWAFVPDSTATGPNQNWDFSDLTNLSTKTITIKDSPNTLPGGNWCSTCDFAMQEEPSGVTSFVDVSNDLLLYRSGIDPNWDNYNGMIILPLPFTLGNTKTNNWTALNGTKKGSTTIVADATGTLITPSGIFTNTLRIHFHSTRIDSSGPPTDILSYTQDEYRWYTPGIHYPLLTAIPAATAFSSYVGSYVPLAAYSTYLFDPFKTTGISSNQTAVESIELYPNPTNDKIMVRSSFKDIFITDISVYTITGEKVLTAINPQSLTQIDVSSLAKGVYYVKVSSNARILKTEKLILSK